MYRMIHSRLCTQSQRVELTRARSHHTATHVALRLSLALSLSLSLCVWVKKGLLYIGYRYREVYRIQYIDRLYIFLVNRYWLSATQSNQTVCVIAHRASKQAHSIESKLCIGTTELSFAIGNLVFFPSVVRVLYLWMRVCLFRVPACTA